MVNIAICDLSSDRTRKIQDTLDDILTRRGIHYRLHNAVDGPALMELLADDTLNISVAFLDTSRISGSNRNLAADVMERFPGVAVFDSSHVDRKDQMSQEFKPVATRLLEQALSHTLRNAESERSKVLTVKAKGAVRNFMIDAIDYIMSDRRLIIIRENGKETMMYAKLDDIEDKIGPGFVRCHQSYLVNMACIKTFDNKKITLFSDIVIPISQKRRIQSREKYYKFLGNSIIYK
jgi:hypothetical protein